MEQQNKDYTYEINIYDLWKIIVKRRRIIIGLFLIIVISAAIVSIFMPKIYRGEVKLNVINNSVLQTIDINKKEIFLVKKAEDAQEIVDIMGSIDDEKKKLILPKVYMSVISVKLRALKDAKTIVATIKAKSTDDVSIAVSELVEFLNNMENVKTSLKEEREMLRQRSVELSNIQKTGQDSLVAYNKLVREGKITAIGFNPLELGKSIVDTMNEKLAVDQALSRLKDGRIQVMTPFSISDKPVSPKILPNVAVAGILSLLIGIALVLFIEHIERIRKVRSVNDNN
jgi:uncharacterized protein involved in exopolysaccharide biosynthesis